MNSLSKAFRFIDFHTLSHYNSHTVKHSSHTFTYLFVKLAGFFNFDIFGPKKHSINLVVIMGLLSEDGYFRRSSRHLKRITVH